MSFSGSLTHLVSVPYPSCAIARAIETITAGKPEDVQDDIKWGFEDFAQFLANTS